MDPLIKSDDVHNAFMDCLYTEEEVKAMAGGQPQDAVIVKGITKHIGFHPGRLAQKKVQVQDWIRGLHINFLSTKDGGGGGWTFLNLCQDRDEIQWTGMHQIMEELVLLAMGLDMADFQMPREMWSVLPGGMPYIEFYPNGKPKAEPLNVYVVYYNTSDFPDRYVCRVRHVTAGEDKPGELIANEETLEAVRAKIPPRLHRLERSQEDDPVIVETWL